MTVDRPHSGGTLARRVVPLLTGGALAAFALFKDAGTPGPHDFGLQQSLLLLAALLLLLESLAAQRTDRFPALWSAIEQGDRFGIVLARLTAAVVASTWLFDFRDYLVDDSYITFRFSRHLAGGLGLVWNPGEAPVEGFSNLLWMLLATLSLRLGLDPLVVSRAVGAACVLGALVVVHRTALRRVRSPGAAAVAPLALACMPALGFWAMSGLETASVVLLVSLAVDAFDREAGRVRWPWRTALWSVLLALSRPEAPAAAVLMLLPLAFGARRDGIAWIARFAVLAGPPVAALFAWRWVTFGSVIPNTLSAKAHVLVGLPIALDFVAYALPLWLLLLVRLAMRRGRLLDWSTACVLVGALLAALNVAPQVAHAHRFFLPVLPMLVACAACAWDDLLASADRPVLAGRVALAGTVALTLIAPVFAMSTYATLESTGLREAHARVADALRRTFPPTALLAASDCGLLAYRSGLRVVDLWGLADKRIATRGFDPDYVLGLSPDVVILHSTDEERFEGREPYDRATYPKLSGDAGWRVVCRARFYGYWLWVFTRRDVDPAAFAAVSGVSPAGSVDVRGPR